MKRKYIRALIASLVMSSFVVTTAMAAPDADAIRKQKEEAEGQVNSLQDQLTEVLGKINDLETKLIEKGEEIEKANSDLEEAEKKEKEQYEAMKLRIKYMYEEGNGKELEKVFSSGSIGELLSQAEYVQSVHTYDRKQLEEYVETKKEIADLSDKLEKEQKALEETEEKFASEKESLNATLEAKRAEVSDLDGQLQAAVEAAAKEAEEKARQEEAARRQEASANNTTNNTGGGTNNVVNNNTNVTPPSNNSNNNSNNSSNSSSNSNASQGNTSVAQAIVNAAYSQLGVPYVWGGTKPGVGLDCSGLTQYAHRVAGISIPRTSGPQGAGGQYVTNPQPGDLVCYYGHVGIYIGGGQMIHAPQPGDVVRVANVYGNPWYRRYW